MNEYIHCNICQGIFMTKKLPNGMFTLTGILQ